MPAIVTWEVVTAVGSLAVAIGVAPVVNVASSLVVVWPLIVATTRT